MHGSTLTEHLHDRFRPKGTPDYAACEGERRRVIAQGKYDSVKRRMFRERGPFIDGNDVFFAVLRELRVVRMEQHPLRRRAP